jgi:hypothetical protein
MTDTMTYSFSKDRPPLQIPQNLLKGMAIVRLCHIGIYIDRSNSE